MKEKQTTVAIIILVIIGIVAAIYYQFSDQKDKCTSKDREISNCVPAGQCGPTPEIDATIDCAVKNYDKKYNPSL